MPSPQIVYEDDDIVVINKPAGLITHQKNLEDKQPSLVDWVIKKHYYALVFGKPKESSGIINAPLGRIGMKRTTQMTGKKLIDGKGSVTEYRTIRNFPAKGWSQPEVKPALP